MQKKRKGMSGPEGILEHFSWGHDLFLVCDFVYLTALPYEGREREREIAHTTLFHIGFLGSKTRPAYRHL